LTIAATGAAVWIGQSRAARGAPSHRALIVASWSIALLALISSQLPFQFDHVSTKMPLVQWKGQTCYVLAKRDSERLLACPTAEHRLYRPRLIKGADVVELDSVGHIYEGFVRR